MSHPRKTFGLQGAEAAQEAFETALSRGRLHHAWLLTGPEGVGKATFAYRAARRLLGARDQDSEQDPVARLVIARSHPDLMVLDLEAPDGKPRRNIPVDEARLLPEFFSKAPAMAPFRVAIIDTADDLNVNAANAVLKTLEEPPERGVLFLISNSPGKLLPTVRSRCRRLAFAPWSEDDIAAFLVGRDAANDHDAALLAGMAHGGPGRALSLAGQGAIEMDRTAHEILRALPDRDEGMMLALAEGFRGGEGAMRFNLLFERLADQVHAMSRRSAMAGETAGLDRWAAAWEQLIRAPREAEGINLDRADVFWTTLDQLRQAARA
ncbi:MAG: DNA polymerase III subunit delta' [Alphaproteobacteria bacterium]